VVALPAEDQFLGIYEPEEDHAERAGLVSELPQVYFVDHFLEALAVEGPHLLGGLLDARLCVVDEL